MTAEPNLWLPRFRPSARATLRLFCFPYSGAGAAIYSAWTDALPPSVEVCPVQLPGRGTRLVERPHDRLGPLVQELAMALRPYLDRPFALFGHSMGALVSFELARLLRRQYALNPVHLFVSAFRAPHLPLPEKPRHALPEKEFIDEVRRLNGTPEEVLQHPELRQLVLPILRADFAVTETYTHIPDRPLECPISAFGGLQDQHVGRTQLEGWAEHTGVGFTLRMFPGDHFFLNSSRSVLLWTLARELNAAASAAAGRRQVGV